MTEILSIKKGYVKVQLILLQIGENICFLVQNYYRSVKKELKFYQKQLKEAKSF
jgi:hypothetical protein